MAVFTFAFPVFAAAVSLLAFAASAHADHCNTAPPSAWGGSAYANWCTQCMHGSYDSATTACTGARPGRGASGGRDVELPPIFSRPDPAEALRREQEERVRREREVEQARQREARRRAFERAKQDALGLMKDGGQNAGGRDAGELRLKSGTDTFGLKGNPSGSMKLELKSYDLPAQETVPEVRGQKNRPHAPSEAVRRTPQWQALERRERVHRTAKEKAEKKIATIEKKLQSGEGDKGRLQVELVHARDEKNRAETNINQVKVEKESFSISFEEKPAADAKGAREGQAK